ncbi:hypothetical protein ABVF61_26415 [Roseibium sp. HPY-6]|uniref:hypothetical protein n=1 Tax=Roseibium sp. HPY-6 TaxID=3229852 RepID=UPI00338E4EB7
MATTIDRPQSAQVVAHATEYPTDKDGDGTGYDRRGKRNSAQRHDTDTGSSADGPAVLIDARQHNNHTLDGVAAYRAAALQAMEPDIDRGPVHPMRISLEGIAPSDIRHAYEDHAEADEPHAVNVAT